jgi:hypothetical protein
MFFGLRDKQDLCFHLNMVIIGQGRKRKICENLKNLNDKYFSAFAKFGVELYL